MDKKYNHSIKKVASKPRSKRLRDCAIAGGIAMTAVASVSQLDMSDKLDRAEFDALFEKVNLGSDAVPIWTIKAKHALWNESEIASKGRPLELPNGDKLTERLDAWTDYTSDAAGWVLSAKLGYGLYLTQNSLLTRVAALEATPGLDTAALEQYLTTNSYAKLSDIPAAVDLSPYAKKADTVTALGVSGNNLTWTKNGVVNSLTVPYAIAASNLTCSGVAADLNASTLNRNGLYWWQQSTQHNPNGGWGAVLQWSNQNSPAAGKDSHWITQLASGTNNVLYCRTITNAGTWTGWRTILDSANYASVLGNVYQPKGNYVTTDTAQTITGAKTFTGEVIATSKWITARIITGEDGSANNTAQRKKAHSIELGYPNHDQMNLNEYGGVFNFYKTQNAFSSTGDGILVAQISPAGVKSTAFIKDGGTASQFLKADGSADSFHYVRALDNAEVGGAVNLNEIWNNATAIGSVAASAHGPAGDNGQWYNVIQLAHRNGKGDGPNYVGQIALGMTVAQDSMYFRGHRTRAWQHVLTSSNYTSELDGRYVKKSGDTMTGLFSAPHISVAGMYWNNTGFMPADAGNNLYTCGKPTGRWANVYATTINVTSTALVANLNADLLDGIQGVNYGYAERIGHFKVGSSRANITTAQFITKLTAMGVFNRTHWTAKCSWSYANNDNITDSGVGNIELAGAVIEVISNHASEYTIRVTTSPTSGNGGVTNAVFIYRNHGSGYAPNWKRLANTSDNVNSATKLATARTLWGRPFDGTGNVSGDMSGVGEIHHTSTGYFKTDTYGNKRATTNTDNNHWNVYRYDGVSALSIKASTGKVGINTTSPAYPLDVAGSAIFTNWVRVRNNDGIYFENHGGGWHMSDNAWVRLYGNKALYCGAGEVRTDAYFNREGYIGTSWGQGYGAYNVAIANNGAQTPLMVAYRLGQSPSVTGANRLFAIELLNSGSQLRFSFGGRASFELWSNGNMHITGATWSDAEMAAKGMPSSSDKRLKANIKDIVLPFDVLLNAPAVIFNWRDDMRGPQRAGTIAQYWKSCLPQVVYTRPDRFLSVDYGALAHIEVTSLAHHVGSELTQLKRRVATLERENKELKRQLSRN